MLTMDANEARRNGLIVAALDKGLPYITAIIMAGDTMSAENATEALEAGAAWEAVRSWPGSYARFNWTLDMQERGFVSMDDVLDGLPELWRGSDPDDTDPRAFRIWQAAHQRNAYATILDGRPLPRGAALTVYRGQMSASDPYGIAWTTDRRIAEKFARGAGQRVRMDGEVIRGSVQRSSIIAYLTGRGEDEVIVDPTLVYRKKVLDKV